MVKRLEIVGQWLVVAASLWFTGIPTTALAQTELSIGTFSFPSLNNVIADIIKAKSFDKDNGFVATPIRYGTGGALWAGVAKGEVNVTQLSPFQLQRMRADGVPIQIIGTVVRLRTLQVITKNPEIKKFIDLKGRTFAATVGLAEFDYLQIYAKKLGFNLRKDVNIVDANTALAQAQLEANRVDAIMAWEPSATIILAKNPDARVIVNGDEAWKFVTGDQGWDLFLAVSVNLANQNAGVLPRLIKMYQDVGKFLREHPDEADSIISSNNYESKNIPPGTISSAVKGNRLIVDVKPSWEGRTGEQIWRMLELGLENQHISALPDKEAVVSSTPK